MKRLFCAAAWVCVAWAASVTWAQEPLRSPRQLTRAHALKMGLGGLAPLSDQGGRQIHALANPWYYDDDYNPGFSSYLERSAMAAFRVPFW